VAGCGLYAVGMRTNEGSESNVLHSGNQSREDPELFCWGNKSWILLSPSAQGPLLPVTAPRAATQQGKSREREPTTRINPHPIGPCTILTFFALLGFGVVLLAIHQVGIHMKAHYPDVCYFKECLGKSSAIERWARKPPATPSTIDLPSHAERGAWLRAAAQSLCINDKVLTGSHRR